MMEHGLFYKIHREMKDLMTIVEFSKGRPIYRADDWPTGVFFVHSGLIGLVLPALKEKSEHTIRFFKEFDVLGFRSILSNERHHAEARALENSTLSFLPYSHFQLLLSTFPEFQFYILQKLAVDLGQAEKSKGEILELDVLVRVAHGLIYLKEISSKHKWKKSEIASYCGTTEATVIRCMRQLENEGLIDQSEKPFRIVDSRNLLKI